METFQIFDDPNKIYSSMIKDIRSAKKYIYLETYIYDDDKIGRLFREELLKKVKEGLVVRLLIDAWGSTVDKFFFNELIKAGCDVRFFREIKYLIRFISKNNERNHRKLLIIDDDKTYIGSMNITESCLNWRELGLRIDGDISYQFAKSFRSSWELYGDITKKRIKKLIHHEYEIIQDIPSYLNRATEKRLYREILKAKKTIQIETPYFVPSLKLINELGKSIKRGVKIDLLIPHRSDVRIVDLARNRYLGRLYNKGVSIHYYTEKTLHSKLLIIDDNFFMLGSSNIDYRSFIHNFEINFVGKDKELIKQLKLFFDKGLKNSRPFNLEQWKRRPSIGKIFELILETIREYI